MRCLCMNLILGLVIAEKTESDYNHHQLFKWVLRDPISSRVIKENITAGTPTFTFTVNDLFPGLGKYRSKVPWGTYWCPSSNSGKSSCNYPGYYLCGYWGCEAIVTSDRWKPEREDEFLCIMWGPDRCDPPTFGPSGYYLQSSIKKRTCTHLNVRIQNPADMGWAVGRMWSVFIHSDNTDPGVVIQIIRIVLQAPQAIGPNPVLNPQTPIYKTENNI